MSEWENLYRRAQRELDDWSKTVEAKNARIAELEAQVIALKDESYLAGELRRALSCLEDMKGDVAKLTKERDEARQLWTRADADYAREQAKREGLETQLAQAQTQLASAKDDVAWMRGSGAIIWAENKRLRSESEQARAALVLPASDAEIEARIAAIVLPVIDGQGTSSLENELRRLYALVKCHVPTDGHPESTDELAERVRQGGGVEIHTYGVAPWSCDVGGPYACDGDTLRAMLLAVLKEREAHAND